MPTDEIVLPITTPETEWVRGRALRKMSPTRDHSRLQMKFAVALDAWSPGRGEVGTEWRFRIAPPGEPHRPLVPDVAFVAFERMRDLGHDEIQAPLFAPTVAVEILSPGDDRRDVASKIDVYLRGGCALAIVVDPVARTIALHDTTSSTLLPEGDVLRHSALPGFNLPIAIFFADALNLPR